MGYQTTRKCIIIVAPGQRLYFKFVFFNVLMRKLGNLLLITVGYCVTELKPRKKSKNIS